MSRIETIVEELRVLPQPQIEEAARFIHQLKESTLLNRREAFAATFGCLTEEEAHYFQKSVDEGCSQVEFSDESISHKW